MCYYLKPPTGTVPLYRLSEFAVRRLTFLLKLFSLKDDLNDVRTLLEQSFEVEGCECLIEGTAKDRISHFILRLAFLSTQEQQEFLMKAESFLFKIRLQRMSLKEKCQMLRVAERHLLELDLCHESNIFAILYSVIQQLKPIYTLYCHTVDLFNGSYLIQVPFQYALPLVSSRSVHLRSGIAFISPKEVDSLLEFLFFQHLALEIKNGHPKCVEICAEDQRFVSLCKKLEAVFLKNPSAGLKLSCNKEYLPLTEIDFESNYFPPCMRVLHGKLKYCHRLKHSARVEYTLFLKEAGLSVDDAIRFWKNEYSKPHSQCDLHGNSSGCSHHWDVDKHRYIYGIRHLYGLEGSKRNYIAHSCSLLQSKTLGPLEEGGCPFKYFDVDKLSFQLKMWGINELDSNNLISLSTMQQYKKACSVYQAYMNLTQKIWTRNITPMEVEQCCTNSQYKKRVDYSMQDHVNMIDIMDHVEDNNVHSTFDFISKFTKSFAKPSECYHLVKYYVNCGGSLEFAKDPTSKS